MPNGLGSVGHIMTGGHALILALGGVMIDGSTTCSVWQRLTRGTARLSKLQVVHHCPLPAARYVDGKVRDHLVRYISIHVHLC